MLLAARALVPATAGDTLLPLDARWRVELPVAAVAPPARDDERVYVPLGDGTLASFAVDDGRKDWTASLAARHEPVTADGLVFVSASEALVALEAQTGSVRWSVPFDDLVASPAVRGSWVVVGDAAGAVAGLRALDGGVVWRRSFESALGAPPTIEGERVYLPLEDGRVVAARVLTGQPLWTRRLGGAAREALAVEDRLYVGSLDNFFYCLDTRDGAVRWRWRTGADVRGAPAADAARIYFTSLDNQMRALDRRTGVQRWRRPLGARPLGGPAVTTGVVLAPISASRVRLYRADTGAPMDSLPASAPLVFVSRFDTRDDRAVLVGVTVDVAGATELQAFGRAFAPPLQPLEEAPGVAVGTGVPLARTELPARWLPLPALPKRVG